MNETEFERRLTQAEDDIKTLFSKTNNVATEQAKVGVKLDNILVTLGELKEGLKRLQEQPANKWDKIVSALISAGVAAFIAYVIK